jgi:hypothetical protein
LHIFLKRGYFFVAPPVVFMFFSTSLYTSTVRISYISAISQWVLVALIACSALAFGQDIEYWPHPLSSSETPPIIAKHSVTAADGCGADAIEEGKVSDWHSCFACNSFSCLNVHYFSFPVIVGRR